MFRHLSSDDIAKIQAVIFDDRADLATRQHVVAMLYEHDMDSDALIAFLLNKVEERVLKPGSIAILSAYSDADDKEAAIERVTRAARERVRSRAGAKAEKTAPPRFLFGPFELLESPATDYDLAEKEYRKVEHLFLPGSHIRAALGRATAGWCSYEDFVRALKGNEKKLKAWGMELEKFFSGRHRRFGWEGERRVDGDKILICVRPTPEWDGITAPEGARTGEAK